jgi:hypothetical protein
MRSLAKYSKWVLACLVAFFVALLINHLVFKFKEGVDGEVVGGVDAEGKPVVDAEGKPVVDAEGKPVVDAAGKPVVDAAGKPVVDAAGKPVVDAAGTAQAPARALLPKTLNELESELDVLKTKRVAFERIIASNQLSVDALKVSSTAKQAEIDVQSNAQAVAEMENQ